MSDDPHGDVGSPGSTADETTVGEAAETAAWERRRRLAEVFGDVLPETTGDERAPGASEDESASDAWLRAQVPPHHG